MGVGAHVAMGSVQDDLRIEDRALRGSEVEGWVENEETSKTVVVKVWSTVQQCQHHLATRQRYTSHPPTPDLLNQELWA